MDLGEAVTFLEASTMPEEVNDRDQKAIGPFDTREEAEENIPGNDNWSLFKVTVPIEDDEEIGWYTWAADLDQAILNVARNDGYRAKKIDRPSLEQIDRQLA